MHGPNPIALITGASSGIGAEFARQLAARHYDLVLVARRAARLEELAGELERGNAVGVTLLPADLTDEQGLAAVEERIKRETRLELLVNNAGFGSRGLFHQAGLATQDLMHRLHVLATMRLTHAALPGMVAGERGGVINVSSVAAFNNMPGNVSYCATKAWMNRFTEGLAMELRAVGSPVRVQALCPGFTRTEFHQALGLGQDFIGDGWWLEARDVVAESLEGLRRGKLVVVPGFRYKVLVSLSKHTPEFLKRAVLIAFARRTARVPGEGK